MAICKTTGQQSIEQGKYGTLLKGSYIKYEVAQ